MKRNLQYGSSVLSTENRACVEMAKAIRTVCNKHGDIYVFWCNDWIIVEGETLHEVNTGKIWEIVFRYLSVELGFTEDELKKITIHNKLTFLGKDKQGGSGGN